jgi:hypothetical protein
MMLQGMLVLLIIVAVVVLPMAALFYGSMAFEWGFHNYPKTAAALAIVLIVALFVAGGSFSHFFPMCRVGIRGGVYCDQNQAPQNLQP